MYRKGWVKGGGKGMLKGQSALINRVVGRVHLRSQADGVEGLSKVLSDPLEKAEY